MYVQIHMELWTLIIGPLINCCCCINIVRVSDGYQRGGIDITIMEVKVAPSLGFIMGLPDVTRRRSSELAWIDHRPRD